MNGFVLFMTKGEVKNIQNRKEIYQILAETVSVFLSFNLTFLAYNNITIKQKANLWTNLVLSIQSILCITFAVSPLMSDKKKSGYINI